MFVRIVVAVLAFAKRYSLESMMSRPGRQSNHYSHLAVVLVCSTTGDMSLRGLLIDVDDEAGQ
jgi:hypothetical protein